MKDKEIFVLTFLVIILLCVAIARVACANDDEEVIIVETGPTYMAEPGTKDILAGGDTAFVPWGIPVPPVEITDKAIFSAFEELQNQFPTNPPVIIWHGEIGTLAQGYWILPHEMRAFVTLVLGNAEIKTIDWLTFDSFGEAFNFVLKIKEQSTE